MCGTLLQHYIGCEHTNVTFIFCDNSTWFPDLRDDELPIEWRDHRGCRGVAHSYTRKCPQCVQTESDDKMPAWEKTATGKWMTLHDRLAVLVPDATMRRIEVQIPSAEGGFFAPHENVTNGDPVFEGMVEDMMNQVEFQARHVEVLAAPAGRRPERTPSFASQENDVTGTDHTGDTEDEELMARERNAAGEGSVVSGGNAVGRGYTFTSGNTVSGFALLSTAAFAVSAPPMSRMPRGSPCLHTAFNGTLARPNTPNQSQGWTNKPEHSNRDMRWLGGYIEVLSRSKYHGDHSQPFNHNDINFVDRTHEMMIKFRHCGHHHIVHVENLEVEASTRSTGAVEIDRATANCGCSGFSKTLVTQRYAESENVCLVHRFRQIIDSYSFDDLDVILNRPINVEGWPEDEREWILEWVQLKDLWAWEAIWFSKHVSLVDMKSPRGRRQIEVWPLAL